MESIFHLAVMAYCLFIAVVWIPLFLLGWYTALLIFSLPLLIVIPYLAG